MPADKISVVIICKNAVSTIQKAIDTSLLVSDDVVIVDSGSTDGTIEKVKATRAVLKQIQWTGYGNAKNLGNDSAVHDWILSLDADEFIDYKLVDSLKGASLSHETTVYSFRRLNYLGSKPVKYGEWGNDIVVRLFNRHHARWDVSALHEKLVRKGEGENLRLPGVLHHFTSPDIETYKLKLARYALLSSEKHFNNGKKVSWLKMFLSPLSNFVVNYILKGGFLSGESGLQISLAHFHYSFEKYRLLRERWGGKHVQKAL